MYMERVDLHTSRLALSDVICWPTKRGSSSPASMADPTNPLFRIYVEKTKIPYQEALNVCRAKRSPQMQAHRQLFQRKGSFS